jgi:DUF971 family protein
VTADTLHVVAATVTDIEIDRERSVTVRFDDGVVHTFDLASIRAACPCAACRARRDRGTDLVSAGDSPTLADAELVGAWGISFRWADGHDTGIYPWDALHRWATGEESGIPVDAPPDEAP